ncbi:ATP-binding cassette sub-family D member 4 [Strongyloides ratti]|uniref:ATP-binding cassette sub-family D member 4 n=1 Tax=Strongyloides ratti TaxID=34506 RepID=A0A090N012_STRRB|nr:ATP-binding cassette sub-family D member 4 [Strongyloides ratti]CEF69880.1 ATP-binding cassette sub-family D member 4 [Strongyloides ratti]
MDKKKDFYFDLKFLKALFNLTPYFFPKNNWYSECIIIFIFILGLTSEWIGYKIGMIPGQMYSALLNDNTKIFWEIIITGSLMYLFKSFIIALIDFTSQCLYLIFRKNITNALHNVYFNDITGYKLMYTCHNDIDNPDIRITQDVDKMSKDLAITIIPTTLICPFVIGYYTYITYITAGGFGCGMIYGYFIIGTIINKLLISPIAKWTNRVEICEGNFRYKEVTIRDNIEEISFYKGQKFEKFETNKFLDKLLITQFLLCIWRFPNIFWKNFFNYFGALLSYGVQYIPIFLFNSYKDIDPKKLPEIISNNAFIYIYLANSFTRLTDIALISGEMAGLLQRVYELLDTCININGIRYNNINLIDENDSIMYKFDNVNISSYEGNVIIKEISLIIENKKNLLIRGPSGSGKTSIIRVLSGLWKISSGEILGKYSIDDIEIIPQKPYLPVGNLSLYQLITFPSLNNEESFEINQKVDIIFGLLEKLQLLQLIEKSSSIFDELPNDFLNTLTPGEIQRLVFIRSIIKNPKIIILDESTNSVDSDIECIMYNIMKEQNIQYISIGHRDSLIRHHDQCLTLKGHNNYTIEFF